MTQDYYLTYNLETRIPASLSGSPFESIPAGLGYCLVHSDDGEAFILGKKITSNYYVTVVNGYAEFSYRWNTVKGKKYQIADNVVQDLNYNINFITGLGITWLVNNNELILTFDLSDVGVDNKNNFVTTVTENNSTAMLYITKHKDPTALLKSFEFDIYQLSRLKKQTFPVEYENISVWASRK